ncbi:xylulokinase [Aggregatilinea lenta]|uniref:xylulokinase n=1 Tax=Aggregatilinea lenta TaxID=913108 RepID=UPI000E5A376A|nr:xylulokinase [Aggregatilinea lenta]
MNYLLGLDVSTTGSKALLIDERGAVVASHTAEHPISHPHPLWSEQDPADWWKGMVESIRAVVAKVGDAGDIKAIGLTGQMHGLVCLDENGKVLRPAILWNDQRTQAECDEITETIGPKRLIELTGNRALTGFTAPKIVWVRKHEPEIYAKIAHVLLPKDYIRFELIDDYMTDLAGASGTLLLDVAKRQWSNAVVDALQIPREWLPQVHEGPEITGVVSAKAAELTGLKAGTPVVGGGGDQAAQATGVGAVKPGIVALTVGTSGVVFAPLPSYAFEPDGRLHAFCHSVPGQWHFMGVMLSAAGSLQWYRDTLCPGEDYGKLTAEADGLKPGSEGLIFLPYLSGERTPHPDPLARGAFVGLTQIHTRPHLTRSVLEGVAFGLRDGFELIKASEAGRIDEVRVSGGGAKSPVWRQILADVFNAPLVVVEALEGAAYGAALLAGVGGGVWPDVATAAETGVKLGERVEPGANAAAYDEVYALYRELYPTLTPAFHKEAEL